MKKKVSTLLSGEATQSDRGFAYFEAEDAKVVVKIVSDSSSSDNLNEKKYHDQEDEKILCGVPGKQW
jgi:hypothetical protein